MWLVFLVLLQSGLCSFCSGVNRCVVGFYCGTFFVEPTIRSICPEKVKSLQCEHDFTYCVPPIFLKTNTPTGKCLATSTKHACYCNCKYFIVYKLLHVHSLACRISNSAKPLYIHLYTSNNSAHPHETQSQPLPLPATPLGTVSGAKPHPPPYKIESGIADNDRPLPRRSVTAPNRLGEHE